VLWLRRLSPASQRGGTGSILGQLKWDLWWTKRHWERAATCYLGFYPSVSFHQSFILTFHTSAVKIYIISATVSVVEWKLPWLHTHIYLNTTHRKEERAIPGRLQQNSALRDLRFSQRCFVSALLECDPTWQGHWVLTFQIVIWTDPY
jgi:hypothetical protein